MQSAPNDKCAALRLWLLWTVATAMSATLVLLVADVLVFYLWVQGKSTDLAFGNDNAIAPVLGFIFFLIVLLGPSIGLAQAFVLGRFMQFPAWKSWTLASVLLVPILHLVTVVALVVLTSKLGGDIYILLGLATFPGIAFGLAQWLVIFAAGVRKSAWLLLANAVAWPLGATCGLLGVRVASAGYFDNAIYRYPFYPLQSALYWAIGWVVAAIVFAAITGIAMVWIKPIPQVS